MKKITLLAVAFVAITFASCKKDRTCACTTTYTSGGSSSEETIYFEVKKSDARQFCAQKSSQTNDTAPIASIGSKTTCELK